MVQLVWNDLPLRYAGVTTDAFVVMPNHVHGIVVLVGSGQAQGPAPTTTSDLSVGADLRVRPQSDAEHGQAQGPAPTTTSDLSVGADLRVRPQSDAEHGQAQGPAPTTTSDLSVGADLRVRPQSDAEHGQAQGPAPTLPMVVQRFKSFTTHQHGGMLWQRNYFEHIVRDDHDLGRIREYIDSNPTRWTMDRENPHCIGEDEFDRWLRSFKLPVGAGSHARPAKGHEDETE